MKKRITAIIISLCMMMGSVVAFAAEETLQITTAEELADAIAAQADGQVWELAAGTYDLTETLMEKYSDIEINGVTDFVFPITANHLTIKGSEGTVITSSFDPNSGIWSAQNFVTVKGQGVTIENLQLKGNKNSYYDSCNKVIELIDTAKDFTLSNVDLLSLTDADGKVNSGSVYINVEDAGNTVLEDVKAEVQARCPYCNDYKYRMYLSRNPDNPTFFCHNCGHRGNAVILFADFNPMLQPMTTQEAYRYLINNPNIHTQANPYFYSPPSLRIRPLWERNIIYMEFLKLLKLEPAHRENLLRRGMSDAIITGSLYKSFPVDPEFRQWVADVLASRFDLTDMPGFYTQNNRWHIAKYGSGILTPVCTADNQIQGLQIRYDTVPIHRHLQADGSLKEKRGCRFGWFSSGGGNYQNGTGIKGYMHVVGNGNSDTVFLTEGVMKSDIASYLSGGSLFVGLTGVNNTRFLAEVIGMLRPRIIVECIDMDKRYNPHVMKAMENIRAICIPLCQNYQPFDWPDRFKGIDDYYLAQRMQQDQAA